MLDKELGPLNRLVLLPNLSTSFTLLEKILHTFPRRLIVLLIFPFDETVLPLIRHFVVHRQDRLRNLNRNTVLLYFVELFTQFFQEVSQSSVGLFIAEVEPNTVPEGSLLKFGQKVTLFYDVLVCYLLL